MSLKTLNVQSKQQKQKTPEFKSIIINLVLTLCQISGDMSNIEVILKETTLFTQTHTETKHMKQNTRSIYITPWGVGLREQGTLRQFFTLCIHVV